MAQNGGLRDEENERARRLHLLPHFCLHRLPSPSAKLPVSIKSHGPFFTLPPSGARVNICINVRGAQVQCEFLRVMLLMTFSFTKGLSQCISLALWRENSTYL